MRSPPKRTIEKMLGVLQGEASNRDLAQGIERHRDQTRQHIANVEEAFRALGEKPKGEPCPSIEGIRREHDELTGQVAPQLRDVVAGGSLARTEHYEMALYRALVMKARALGESDAARLLQENLGQDEKMAKEVDSLAERLLAQQPAQARADGSGPSEELNHLSGEELQKRAREAGIEGRSKMSKPELIEALQRATQ